MTAETATWVQLERVQLREAPQGLPSALSEPDMLRGCVFLG